MVLQASTENRTLGFDDADTNFKLAATLTPLLQSSPFVPLVVHPALVPFQLTLRCPPGEHPLVPRIGYTGETRGIQPWRDHHGVQFPQSQLDQWKSVLPDINWIQVHGEEGLTRGGACRRLAVMVAWFASPRAALPAQPRSSQDLPAFRHPLDIERMFMSNPPSPSAAPECDSIVAASASKTPHSTPTHVPRWLQELMDAEPVDSPNQPHQKRDKDEVASGNSPADASHPTRPRRPSQPSSPSHPDRPLESPRPSQPSQPSPPSQPSQPSPFSTAPPSTAPCIVSMVARAIAAAPFPTCNG